jgi:hypothetical protein
VSGGGECLADDLGDDPCFRPDSDCRHRGQDEVKRVGLHEGFDPGEDLGARGAQLGQLRGELGQDDPGGSGAGDDHGLLAQCGEDIGGPALASPRRGPGHELGYPVLPCALQGVRGRVFLQQFGHGGVVQVRSDGAFQDRWIWVRRPRIRFDAAVACLARWSSKPQSMDSSAACSSATAMERRVCGMVLAASAMIAASLASSPN